MEVRESATCAVAEREFVIELSEEEIRLLYSRLKAVNDANPNDEFLEELVKEIGYVAGLTQRP